MNSTILFYLLLAALAFLTLFYALKKLTLQIDIQEENEALKAPKAEIYPEFCDIISNQILNLKERVNTDKLELLEEDKKDKLLESLSDLNRKLTFIQTMNLSKKSDEIWQKELFSFLKELEDLLLENLKEGKKEADDLRTFLMNAFENLQKKA